MRGARYDGIAACIASFILTIRSNIRSGNQPQLFSTHVSFVKQS